MSKSEEMASLLWGWLDMLRNPHRIESARSCLKQALEAARAEGRAEGFARAREMAAEKADAYSAEMLSQDRADRAEAVDDVAEDIRTMQDDTGEGT